MSARVHPSQIDRPASAVDKMFVKNEEFLRSAVERLERLQEESEAHGHHLLASLLAITKGEAEDDLKSCINPARQRAREQDDGAAEMAQRLARRGDYAETEDA